MLARLGLQARMTLSYVLVTAAAVLLVEALASAFIAAGADCYLLKTAGVEDVLGTIRAAAAGRSVLDAEIAARILRPARPARSSAVDELSRREVEVLIALARGRSNKEIAAGLEIGEQTVKTHVSNILDKLRLQDRTQAAVFALRQRLVPLDE